MVIGKDFSTVSGDILDFLKSISGKCCSVFPRQVLLLQTVCVCAYQSLDLKSCVFSFACESPGNPLYLETLEER